MAGAVDPRGCRWSRAECEARATVPPVRCWWKAGKWTVRLDGTDVLVKDVRRSSPLFRWCWGRLLVRREAVAYERLEGLPFVPRYIGLLDADAILLEVVPGTSLADLRKREVSPEFFRRLGACVAALHERGICHLDLRTRRNILVGPGETPVLLDFANAIYVGNGWRGRLLGPLLRGIDRAAILKHWSREYPELLSEAERRRARRVCCLSMLWFFGPLFRQLGLSRPRQSVRPFWPWPRRKKKRAPVEPA